jgi:AraC family transcriptional regulator, regulatory protein of adaptative response / methylated-DNA-[protein]-cysteine methyltransferase
MKSLPSPAEMERAFRESDGAFDGIFFAAVKTTGIFCRPSCPAKKPHPQNLEYFASARKALEAGYRACKRCSPLEPNGRPPAWVQSLMTRIDAAPATRWTTADLSALGIEPARARRYFLAHHGMTFQQYCRNRRMGMAREQLRRGGSLDDAAIENGYESHSGFRDAFSKVFGTSAGRGAEVECIMVSWVETPLGVMLAGANERGICLLEFTEAGALDAQFETLRRRFRCAILPGNNAHLDAFRDELTRYFSGALRTFTVPLVFPGTPFQQRVWRALLRIPYGKTCSYEAVAREVGSPGAVRAVGAANGCNRICIIIPCHRVVNKSGQLGGYGGGLWRKRFLLELERGNQR